MQRKLVQAYLLPCLALFFLALWLTSCHSDSSASEERGATYVAFDTRTIRGETSNNVETVNNGDRENNLLTLRIIAFDHVTGDVRYNRVLDGSLVSQQTASATAKWHGAFEMVPGTYDFFFIANEAVGDATMRSALPHIQNRAEFFTSPAFTRYPLTQAEYEGTAPAMLMTQCYEAVTVNATRNGKGRTADDPQHFIATGATAERVVLVRTLAKTTLNLENVVVVEDGKFVLKLSKMPALQSLTLENLPHQSLFGSPYFAGYASPYTVDYYNPIIRNTQTVRVFTPSGGRVQGELNTTTDMVQNGTVAGKYNYFVTRYVPELLRSANASENKAEMSIATALGWRLNSTAKVTDISIDHRLFNNLSGYTENNSSGQVSVNILDQYTLPTPANYSRYSVLRNTWYIISAVESDEGWRFSITKPDYTDGGVWECNCSGFITQ